MSRSDHSLDDGTQRPQATFQAVRKYFSVLRRTTVLKNF
jgi:hypothetical protein